MGRFACRDGKVSVCNRCRRFVSVQIIYQIFVLGPASGCLGNVRVFCFSFCVIICESRVGRRNVVVVAQEQYLCCPGLAAGEVYRSLARVCQSLAVVYKFIPGVGNFQLQFFIVRLVIDDRACLCGGLGSTVYRAVNGNRA